MPLPIASLLMGKGGTAALTEALGTAIDATTGTAEAEGTALEMGLAARLLPFDATGFEAAPATTTARRSAATLAAVVIMDRRRAISAFTIASTRGDTATFLQVAWPSS